MGKRYGKPYDPKMRETEHGKHLYSFWRKVNHSPHCEEWGWFPAFYDWATKNGYEIGMRLQLIDDSQPYSPDNCEWCFPIYERSPTATWADDWNKAANRIRKYFGMPPLEGTSYDDL